MGFVAGRRFGHDLTPRGPSLWWRNLRAMAGETGDSWETDAPNPLLLGCLRETCQYQRPKVVQFYSQIAWTLWF